MTSISPQFELAAGGKDDLFDRVEALRGILARQQRREVSHIEAREIGTSPVGFYHLLAEEAGDEPKD